MEKSRINTLDGLRGISVLIVVVGHLFFLVPLHSFIDSYLDPTMGVRIFFTISGFVITALLLNELELTGKIRWSHFYAKRFTKLFPTLALVVAVVAITGPYGANACGPRSYLSALLFLSQFVLTHCWHLHHTWSLSVEEFFYLTWAPILTYVSRRMVITLAWALVLLGPVARTQFYLMDTGRTLFPFVIPGGDALNYLDGLGMGCLAAIAMNSRKVRTIPSSLIYSTLALAIFLRLPFYKMPYLNFGKYFGYPLCGTVAAVATSLVILSSINGQKPTLIHRLLSLRPLVFLGKASYSIYLWQQLCTALDWPFLGITYLPLDLAVRFIASLGIGAVSFLYFEQPVMNYLRKRMNLGRSALVVEPNVSKKAA